MSYVLDGLVYVLGHSVFRFLMMVLADISFWLCLAIGVFFVGTHSMKVLFSSAE